MAKSTGTVKWFNATKGFGFITPDDGGGDLFCHQTNIVSEGFRSLRDGETVEFFVETGPDGRTKAIDVTGPGGAPVQGSSAPAPRSNDGYGSFGGGGGRGGFSGGRSGAGGGGGYSRGGEERRRYSPSSSYTPQAMATRMVAGTTRGAMVGRLAMATRGAMATRTMMF